MSIRFVWRQPVAVVAVVVPVLAVAGETLASDKPASVLHVLTAESYRICHEESMPSELILCMPKHTDGRSIHDVFYRTLVGDPTWEDIT